MTNIKRIDPFRLQLEQAGPMRTHGLVYANGALEELLMGENAIEQVANVACLPGIVGPSMAMPDIHWGYGFPIGGVAAFDLEEGVISPGGVGYDINCGIRCVATDLKDQQVRERLSELLPAIYRRVPCGVGSRGAKVSKKELKQVLRDGAAWLVSVGLTPESELLNCEEGGVLSGGDMAAISARAIERGLPQLGTLGSGNHFIEIDVVESIAEPEIAKAFGLEVGQVVVLIHTGSRGLGYQVCDDYLHSMLRNAPKLPDRQLSCAPLKSDAAKEYMSAMAAAANFAFANRSMITANVREAFEAIFGRPDLSLLYDCCHNIAKIEEVEGRKLCVHRKGATRALPPGDQRLPDQFKSSGQPIIVPGDMGTCSYILAGDHGSSETFNSACHGAGRQLSRNQAKKRAQGRNLFEELKRQNVTAMAASNKTLAEEMPEAYKDVNDVVQTMAGAGVVRIVAKVRPMAVIKG